MGQVPAGVERRFRQLRSELAAAKEEIRAQQAQIALLTARMEEVEAVRRELLGGDDLVVMTGLKM